MSPSKRHDNNIEAEAKPETILVVDDEKIIRELCEKALREYHVLQAGTCAEAMLLYSHEPIDLILTDVMMPGGTGIDLLRQIKQLDPNAVVIIMTGFAEKETILNALKSGAADFINKPLNLLQLRTAVESALSKKRLQEELANLKRLDRLKSNFLSLISHKLRTPITAISLFLQNVQQGVHDMDAPLFRQTAKLINEEAAYLGRMVTDLLAFSQVMEGSEGLKIAPCNLNRIVAEVMHSSREAQAKPGVVSEVTEVVLPAMRLDKIKITFALQQIIDNAYKFSGDTGYVYVNICNNGDTVCIVVTDTGCGISSEEIAKVFEKFYQIDPDNTGQVRGFGLGLFYAREFIRQHDGSVSMESKPGMGTTVTISLPLQ